MVPGVRNQMSQCWLLILESLSRDSTKDDSLFFIYYTQCLRKVKLETSSNQVPVWDKISQAILF